jgi:hypothetical protein
VLRQHGLLVGTAFRSDGAPPHFFRHVLAFMDREFPDQWLGIGELIPWLPNSPGLTPLEFLFWESLKDTVAVEMRKNMNVLRGRIVRSAYESVSKSFRTGRLE